MEFGYPKLDCIQVGRNVVKIKTLKEFIKYIKKSKLTAKEESIVRMKFILEELDDDYFMNREKRRVV